MGFMIWASLGLIFLGSIQLLPSLRSGLVCTMILAGSLSQAFSQTVAEQSALHQCLDLYQSSENADHTISQVRIAEQRYPSDEGIERVRKALSTVFELHRSLLSAEDGVAQARIAGRRLSYKEANELSSNAYRARISARQQLGMGLGEADRTSAYLARIGRDSTAQSYRNVLLSIAEESRITWYPAPLSSPMTSANEGELKVLKVKISGRAPTKTRIVVSYRGAPESPWKQEQFSASRSSSFDELKFEASPSEAASLRVGLWDGHQVSWCKMEEEGSNRMTLRGPGIADLVIGPGQSAWADFKVRAGGTELSFRVSAECESGPTSSSTRSQRPTTQFFEEITLIKSQGKIRTYHEVKVTEIGEESVRIIHRAGAATVDIVELPMAVRQRLNLETGQKPESVAVAKNSTGRPGSMRPKPNPSSPLIRKLGPAPANLGEAEAALDARRSKIEGLLLEEKVGEGLDGRLRVRNCNSAEQQTVAEENRDRETVFRIEAEKRQISSRVIGREKAADFMKRLKPGMLRQVMVDEVPVWWDGKQLDPREGESGTP